jgi:hypothetical protein
MMLRSCIGARGVCEKRKKKEERSGAKETGAGNEVWLT